MKKITSVLFLIAIFSMCSFAQQYSKLSDFPEELKNTKQFKRFKWMHEQRAFPYDTIPYTKANTVFRLESQKIKKQQGRHSDQVEWHSRGPAGIQDIIAHWGISSGRVRAIAVHPNDPLTVYMGAATGGIWKTTDGGNTWLDIGRHLESLNFGAIAIDPNNPETIYAGSGEVGYMADVYDGLGLFKSTDGGATWAWDTISFGDRTHFSKIDVSPNNSNLLLASLAGGTFGTYPTLEMKGYGLVPMPARVGIKPWICLLDLMCVFTQLMQTRLMHALVVIMRDLDFIFRMTRARPGKSAVQG